MVLTMALLVASISARAVAAEAVTFSALHYPSPNSVRVDRSQYSYGTFNLRGPFSDSLQPLPSKVTCVAVDPRGPEFFGSDGRSLVRIDLKKKAAIRIPAHSKLPPILWPGCVAFDTKRRRVVVVRGAGEMYAFDPVKEKWSQLSGRHGIELSSLAYAAEADCFYGIGMPPTKKSKSLVYQFDGDGVLQRQFELPPDLLRDRDFFVLHHEQHDQLVASGRLLILITKPTLHTDEPNMPLLSRCHLIDPASGKVIISCSSELHNKRPTVTLDEPDAAWEKLLEAEGLEAELLMWRMAAGKEHTVALVKSKLTPIPRPDPRRIEAQINGLDAYRNVVREAAAMELRKVGDPALAALRQLLVAKPAADLQNRAEKLVMQIEADIANDNDFNPELRREARAIRILGRIGAPAAEYLRELDKGPEGALRTRRARAALELIPRP